MRDEQKTEATDDERAMLGLWLSRRMFGWMVGMPEDRSFDEWLAVVRANEERAA